MVPDETRTEYSYLASPYTGYTARGKELVYLANVHCAAKLALAGMTVFSAIAYTHSIDVVMRGAVDSKFWYRYDYPFLTHMNMLLILKLPLYAQSEGILFERSFAFENNIPVTYIAADEYVKDWPADLTGIIKDEFLEKHEGKE